MDILYDTKEINKLLVNSLSKKKIPLLSKYKFVISANTIVITNWKKNLTFGLFSDLLSPKNPKNVKINKNK